MVPEGKYYCSMCGRNKVSDPGIFCPTCVEQQKTLDKTAVLLGALVPPRKSPGKIIQVIISVILFTALIGMGYIVLSPVINSHWGRTSAYYRTPPSTPAPDNNGPKVSSGATIVGFYQYFGVTLVLESDNTGKISGAEYGAGSTFHWDDRGSYYDITGWNYAGADGGIAKIKKINDGELEIDYRNGGSSAYDTVFKVAM